MNGMHESIKDQMNQFKQTRNNDQNDDSISAESEDADDVVQGIDPSILEGLSAADRADVIASLQKIRFLKTPSRLQKKLKETNLQGFVKRSLLARKTTRPFGRKIEVCIPMLTWFICRFDASDLPLLDWKAYFLLLPVWFQMSVHLPLTRHLI